MIRCSLKVWGWSFCSPRRESGIIWCSSSLACSIFFTRATTRFKPFWLTDRNRLFKPLSFLSLTMMTTGSLCYCPELKVWLIAFRMSLMVFDWVWFDNTLDTDGKDRGSPNFNPSQRSATLLRSCWPNSSATPQTCLFLASCKSSPSACILSDRKENLTTNSQRLAVCLFAR